MSKAARRYALQRSKPAIASSDDRAHSGLRKRPVSSLCAFQSREIVHTLYRSQSRTQAARTYVRVRPDTIEDASRSAPLSMRLSPAPPTPLGSRKRKQPARSVQAATFSGADDGVPAPRFAGRSASRHRGCLERFPENCPPGSFPGGNPPHRFEPRPGAANESSLHDPCRLRHFLERTTGFEPATPTLARSCSTS